MPADRGSDQAGAPCDVTLLATSDLHLHLCPWDPFADRPRPGQGLAAAAARIAALRRAEPNAFLFDNGDLLQGTPLGDALAAGPPPTIGRPHPMVAALGLLGYDAMALGNHDFDFGLDFLAAAVAGARFPVLCANLRHRSGGVLPFGGWVILRRRVIDRAGRRRWLRLGVAGFLPPQVVAWSGAGLAEVLVAGGIVETARRIVPQMRAAGADVVVALCHSGIGEAEAGNAPWAEHAALALAMVPGIDAVIGGHSHEVFPDPAPSAVGGHVRAAADPARADQMVDRVAGRLAGTPACLPGHSASHLGMVRLVLEPRADGGWRMRDGTGAVLPLTPASDPRPPPAPFRALCAAADRAARRYLDRPAGTSRVPLTTYFTLIGDCLAPCLVGQALQWHVRDLVAGTGDAGLPVLAAVAPLRSGGRGGADNYTDLPAGPLRERDLAALCPYPDTLRVLRLNGAMLHEWLEHSAGIFGQIAPGARDVPLLVPERPGYNFDTIIGLNYRIDLSQPPRYDAAGRLIDPQARRIHDLCHEGRPLDPRAEFLLATSSYRAGGGGNFPGSGDTGRQALAAPVQIRNILGAYLISASPFAPASAPVWRFVPQPGASATIATSPAAAAHLPRPGLEPLGQDAAGFLRLRIRL